MAINATIQVRRGLKADFDPTKMLPGEWAVSIDASTSNQIVWMCFAPGVCKRMGTYEDFKSMISQANGEIIEELRGEFEAILAEVESVAKDVSDDKEEVLVVKSDILNTYIPQIQNYVNTASTHAKNAKASETNAKTSENNAKVSEINAAESASEAKTYASQALSTTPDGYNQMVSDVDLLKNSIIQTTDRTLYGSKEGGIKLIGIGGASEQGENPSPDNPQEIESVGDSGSLVIKDEGKNQIDLSDVSSSNIDYTLLANGVRFYSDSSSTYKRNQYVRKLKPNTTYTISADVEVTSGMAQIGWRVSKDNGATYPTALSNNTTAVTSGSRQIKKTFTTDENVYYQFNVFGSGATASVTDILYTNVQLEEGETVTTYEPHRSKSITIPLSEPLRSSKDKTVRDLVAVVDGVWGVLRYIPVLTIDGNGIGKNDGTDSNSDYLYYYHVYNNNGINKLKTVGLCDSLTHNTVANLMVYGNDGFNTDASTKSIYFNLSSYVEENTVSAMKAYLAEKPIKVGFAVKNPTFEPFADQTPFYGLESFDTVTYISTDSEVEPTVILKFAKTEGDAVTLLNYNQTNLNRIAIAELTNAVLALNQE